MAEKTDEQIAEEKAEAEKVAAESKNPPVRLTGAALRIHDKKVRDEATKKAEEDKDDDEELTPKAQKLIAEEVARQQSRFSDDYEIRNYLGEHPEMRKHEKAIRARVEAWGDKIPVDEIAKTIAPQEVSKEAEKEAKEKIAGKQLGGSSSRAEETKLPSTQEDFKKIYENVKKNRATIKLGEID